MSPIENIKSNYRLLGLNRIFPEPSDQTIGLPNRDFSVNTYNSLKFTDKDRLEMRLLRRTLVQIFEVNNLSQIHETTKGIEGKENKKKAYKKFVTDYSTMYGLSEVPFNEKELLIKNALNKANDAISLLENPETGIVRNLKNKIGQINEIGAINNPVDLLLLIFSPNTSKRMRYEARRKLVYMDLAFRSNFDLLEKSKQMDNFLRFLNINVWEGGLGITHEVEVVSDHSLSDYSCRKIQVLSPGETISVSDYRRYTSFSTRSWINNKNNKTSQVYFENRLKSPINLIFKMIRKNTQDPKKIDDYLGLEFVFQTKKEIYDFLETIQIKGSEVGTMIMYEEIEDSIDNSDCFTITNKGSSSNLQAVKVHAKINGIRVEFLMHTFKTYMDSRYHDEFGFEQFAIKRLFDSGLMESNYPEDIYGLDISKYKEVLLQERRNSVRSTSSIDIPLNRREEKGDLLRYTIHDFRLDMVNIIKQMEVYPEIIIAVGHSGGFMASSLSKLLGGIQIIEYKTENEVIDPNKFKGKKVLIVNGIVKDGRKIKKLKKLLPDSKVAAIAVKDEKEKVAKLINFRARTISKNTWFRYYWELPEIEVALAQGLLLFYKISNGEVLFLVEESQKAEDNQNGNNLKLLGGKHEKIDKDLLETALRELKEETGKKELRKNLVSLSSLSYDFEPFKDDYANIRKGFSQAFAKRASKNFKLTPKTKDVGKFIWINVDDFKKRSRWQSYVKGIDIWIKEIKKIEGLK